MRAQIGTGSGRTSTQEEQPKWVIPLAPHGGNLSLTLQRVALEANDALRDLPLSVQLTALLQHGGLEILQDPEAVPSGLAKFAAGERAAPLARALSLQVRPFFSKLEPHFQYQIPSSLIDFLAEPPAGRTFSAPGVNDPSTLPAAVTFMGQFIDHDLTKNAFDLFQSQTGSIPDVVSPLIDLDSVYGPRSDAAGAPLFLNDGRFRLRPLGNHAYDVPRNAAGKALIADGRNDENQIILQIHLLLMRLHNVLILQHGMNKSQAKRETVFTWQSIVLDDYLPRVADHGQLQFVATEIVKPGHGALLHKPNPHPPPLHLPVSMPHEFAIGFRFGHSQLREDYTLSAGHQFSLFNNLDPGPDFHDLRGDRPLTPDRVIDWPFFFAGGKGNKIDHKVTNAVFKLPESTIPDNIKTEGNLPRRNLIRSRQIKLTSGERLAHLFAQSHPLPILTPAQVEPDASKHGLFKQQQGEFATPLWYYIIKEGEQQSGNKLGALGSRLVSEVLLGGIYYNNAVGQDAFVFDPAWKAVVNGKTSNSVKFENLFHFVAGKPA